MVNDKKIKYILTAILYIYVLTYIYSVKLI